MADGNDVCTEFGNDSRNGIEFTGLVREGNSEFGQSACFLQAPVNDSGKNRNINITARYKTTNFFAFEREFIKERDRKSVV